MSERRSKGTGDMTVAEAGRLGGQATSERYGPSHYERIGRLGGQKVKRLIQLGREQAAKEDSDG